ncbi:MAG: HTH-type transcriptional activator Btr [Lentisphaerae bacterium ADurb.Bin242]|nr:MAG: HTH-type transcriptional activator Btr [Lentisphaerae bacterium ADurb.Bin242]
MSKTQPIIYDMGNSPRNRASQARLPFHNDYGLWIFRWRERQCVPTYQTPIPRKFEFYNICHLLEGRGWFWQEGQKKRDLAPGDAILNMPGVIQDYNGYDEFFVEDFICFGGPVADMLAQSGVFSQSIVRMGMTRRLLPIIRLVEITTKAFQLKANMALQNLIVELHLESQKTADQSRHGERLEDLLREIQCRPDHWWTVSEMAEFMDLSVNQFIHIFHSKMDVTPKQYLDNFKLRRIAEDILKDTEPLSETAKRYGYLDYFHFSKRFKQVIGCSPLEYRKHFMIKPVPKGKS